MTILVTGAAGFCGMHVSAALASCGGTVVGIDNFSPYYDVGLKKARVAHLKQHGNFTFAELDLLEATAIKEFMAEHGIQRVVHLAAQPGVRRSITHPEDYIQNNLVAFSNVLEACRDASVKHLVYASSSSVYGANTKTPFSEHDSVDHPVSLYAATKKANELLAHSYSHLYGLPTTGLRFFTVYGPWGRPDMAPWLFTEAILAGRPIRVFNNGQSLRDFTYVADVAAVVAAVLDKPPSPSDSSAALDSPQSSTAPYRILNVGNERPVALLDFIATLESALGVEANMQFEPAQPGDMVATAADVSCLRDTVGFAPGTPIAEGLRHWVEWYRSYHGAPEPERTPA